MYSKKLIETLSDRFGELHAYLSTPIDRSDDIYSHIASILYGVPYEDCREWKDGKPNPEGKSRRSNVKQMIIPIVHECDGLLEPTKVKYRPHRGTLEDAMKEYREFDSIKALVDFVVKDNFGYISPEDVVISSVIGADPRIGWEEYRFVLVKRFGDELYDAPQCIGWCEFCYADGTV